jgi:hypothetical protein
LVKDICVDGMAIEDIDRHLPEKNVHSLEHKALKERKDFSGFIAKILQKRLDNPGKTTGAAVARYICLVS